MATFTDCLGREHTLRITVANLRPLRELGLSIDKIAEAGEALGTLLFGDRERLADAIWAIRSGDALARPEFDDGMDGLSLERGGESMVEAVIDFSPRSKIAEKMRGRVRTMFDQVDREMLRTMEATELNASVGNSAV